MNTKQRLAVLGALALSFTSAHACDMHGGFGFSPMYGMHKLGNQLTDAQRPQANVSPITLAHPSVTSVEANSDSSITLRYAAPNLADRMKIEIESSDQLQLEGNTTIELNDQYGSHKVAFVAANEGEHKITVLFSAMIDQQPRKLKRVIRVVARPQQLTALSK